MIFFLICSVFDLDPLQLLLFVNYRPSLYYLFACLLCLLILFSYDHCSYDAEAFFFDEGVRRTSKREQLESKLLQAMPLFSFVIFQLEKIPHELFHINI